eukprot:2853193-Pleurochrysis_carterae.AAC.5
MEPQATQQLAGDEFCTPLPVRPSALQSTDCQAPYGGLSVKYGSDDDMSTGGLSMRSPDPHGSCPCISIDIPDAIDPLDEFLTKPLLLEHGKLRCVLRRKGPTEVHMLLEKGNVFLLSARRIGREWVITAHANHESRNKALSYLRYDKKEQTFTCIRRDALRASKTVWPKPLEYLHLQHSTLELHEDLPELNVIQAAFLPSATDILLGSPAGELAALLRDPDAALRTTGPNVPAILSTKIPKYASRCAPHCVAQPKRAPCSCDLALWNARSYAFELPFHGRAACASERNLQAAETHECTISLPLCLQLVCKNYNNAERVVLLHGKLDEETFSLDFRYPLSPMHAFVIALSTWDW